MSDAQAAAQHHVVIVGGGFGGLNAAKALGKAGCRVTLLDKRNFQLFQPLLYQVATGSLTTGDIAIPQRVVLRKFPRVQCLTSTAYDVDPVAKKLIHEFGELAYDTLIVATGVKHHYFGREEWREHAPGLKTVEHAIEIRRKIFGAFELAEVERDPEVRKALMTFVVAGGGPTGVELAGAIGELAHKTMVSDFRSIDPREARVLLAEGGPEILPSFAPKLRAAAKRHLEQLGVTVMTGTRVEYVAVDHVRVRAGDAEQTIATRTVLWAAGVTASMFGKIVVEKAGGTLDRSGRVQVQADCSLPGHPEIFVIGDLARLTDAAGRDVPGLAPAAIQQGQYVAKLLRARIQNQPVPRPFRYTDMGTMAVIGMNKAVGDLKIIKLSGMPGWLMWAFVHILALIDGAQRARVFVLWAWKFFTRKIGDRLITGAPTKTRELRAARSRAATP
jgi:NADH:ubiquinone reductase (H+-translocating)